MPRDGSKLEITLPEEPIEYWWEPGSSSPASIEEDRVLSEYDCGYLDLGAETPSTFHFMPNSNLVTHIPAARRSPVPKKPSRLNRYAADRDCGICFENAVVPCKTLCCGKVFCTEHLADWLHGPEAEGRCPNCQNACSLVGGTLSLASPNLLSSSQGKPNNNLPPIIVQSHPNDTLANLNNRLHPPMGTNTTDTSSTCSSVACSDTSVSIEELRTQLTKIEEQRHINTHSFTQENSLTSPLSLPWGVASRLVSILIFLMFLYKLRS